MSKYIGNLFFITSFFPWLGVPSLDSQPFSIIFALLFLSFGILVFSKNNNIPAYILAIFALIIFGLAFVQISSFQLDFLAIRGVVNYIGIPILILAYYKYNKMFGIKLNIIIIINTIWLLASLLQLIYPYSFDMLVAFRTTEGRGVPSLAPEPTFFAIYLIFISWILILCSHYKPSKIVVLLIGTNLMTIIFIAKSSMGLLIIILAFMGFWINNFKKMRPIHILHLLLITIGIFILINIFLNDSRINEFISLLLYSPTAFFTADASANLRLSDIILPIYGLFDNYMMPNGFHSYSQYTGSALINGFDIISFNEGSSKIGSWLGSIVYELGFIGLFVVLLLFYGSFGFNIRKYFMSILFIIILLLTSIPIAFPLIYYVFILFRADRLELIQAHSATSTN